MDMTLIFILAVQTVAIVCLAVMLIQTSRRMKDSIRRAEMVMLQLQPQVTQVLDEARQVLGTVRTEIQPRVIQVLDDAQAITRALRPVGEQLADAAINIQSAVEHARDITADVSEFIQDTTRTARRQVTQVDQVVTDTIKGVQTASRSLIDNVLNPISEVSSLLKGIQTAFMYVRGKRFTRPIPEKDHYDDMYI